jgi:hypothetical protein
MSRIRILLVTIVCGAAALAASAPAGAVVAPGTFATARDDQLIVVSSVIVGARTVEMMGGWNDDAVPCSNFRRLDVSILIDRVRGSQNQRRTRMKSEARRNCAEGGPNLGFVLRASSLGMACADGTWRPGHYDFVTNTLHRARQLRSIASLFFTKTEPCN